MGILGLRISNDLETRFRKKVFERKGMKKGNITEALEEAIEDWIEKKPSAKLARPKKTPEPA